MEWYLNVFCFWFEEFMFLLCFMGFNDGVFELFDQLRDQLHW